MCKFQFSLREMVEAKSEEEKTMTGEILAILMMWPPDGYQQGTRCRRTIGQAVWPAGEGLGCY